MPSHYAHYYFGNQVIKSASDNIKDIVNSSGDSLDAFMLGLHGPDILFFYKAYSKNPINEEGSKIHEEKGQVFLEKALKYVKSRPTNENISYLLGFMCHFMLDTACHPLVNQYMNLTGLSHSRIETEFDSYIIRELGKDPLKTYQLPHINNNDQLGEIIAPFYESTGADEIKASIKWMVDILSVVTSKSGLKRTAAKTILKIGKQYDNHGGMIVMKRPYGSTSASNIELFNKLKETIEITVKELDYLLDSVNKDLPLTERSKMNFNGEII